MSVGCLNGAARPLRNRKRNYFDAAGSGVSFFTRPAQM